MPEMLLYGINHYGPLPPNQVSQFQEAISGVTTLAIENAGHSPGTRADQRRFASQLSISRSVKVNSSQERPLLSFALDTMHRLMLLPRSRRQAVPLAFVDLPQGHPTIDNIFNVASNMQEISRRIFHGEIQTEADFNQTFPDWIQQATRFMELNQERNVYIADELAKLHAQNQNLEDKIVVLFGNVHLIPLQTLLQERGIAATVEFEKGDAMTPFVQFMSELGRPESPEPETDSLLAIRALFVDIFDNTMMNLQSAFLKLEHGNITVQTIPPDLKTNYMKQATLLSYALSKLSFEEIKNLIINADRLDPKQYQHKLRARINELASDFSESE